MSFYCIEKKVVQKCVLVACKVSQLKLKLLFTNHKSTVLNIDNKCEIPDVLISNWLKSLTYETEYMCSVVSVKRSSGTFLRRTIVPILW